jgi:hypothetical protein
LLCAQVSTTLAAQPAHSPTTRCAPRRFLELRKRIGGEFSPAATLNMTTTMAVVRDVPTQARVIPDSYFPELGTYASMEWYNKVQAAIRVIEQPKPPIEVRLKRQSEATQVRAAACCAVSCINVRACADSFCSAGCACAALNMVVS